MRIIWFLVWFAGVAWASCSGDCASCHSGLDFVKDKRHTPMVECKSCHTEEKMSQIDMGSGCGKDCFACHDVQKIRTPTLYKSHKIIDNCINCHKGLSSSVFNPTLQENENIFKQGIQSFSNELIP